MGKEFNKELGLLGKELAEDEHIDKRPIIGKKTFRIADATEDGLFEIWIQSAEKNKLTEDAGGEFFCLSVRSP
jgi:hypothetical protein